VLRCIECTKPIADGSDISAWHNHCATVALSVITEVSGRGCPACGQWVDAPNYPSRVVDYLNRVWHFACALVSLAELAHQRVNMVLDTARRVHSEPEEDDDAEGR
jgi:hypothetical protein